MSNNTINIALEISTVDGNVVVKTSSSEPAITSSHVAQVECNVVVENKDKYDKVFIYDIDDLTLLSEKQLEEVAKNEPKIKDVSVYLNLVKKIITKGKINDPTDTDDIDLLNIENAVDDGTSAMKSVVEKYRFLKYIYGKMADDKKRMSSTSDRTYLVERWNKARKCLELANERSGKTDNKKYANVVLCNGGITRGVAQIASAGFAADIELENVYSTATRPIQSVLETIQKKYGDNSCRFIVVTSNKNTIDAATKLWIPVWPADSDKDFVELYKQQREVWLLEKKMDQVEAVAEAPTKIQQALNGAVAQAESVDAQIGGHVDQALDRAIAQAVTIETQVRERAQLAVFRTLAEAQKAEVEARTQAFANVRQQLQQLEITEKHNQEEKNREKNDSDAQERRRIEQAFEKVMDEIRSVEAPSHKQFEQALELAMARARISTFETKGQAQMALENSLPAAKIAVEAARARTQQAVRSAITEFLDVDRNLRKESQEEAKRILAEARRAEIKVRVRALANIQLQMEQLMDGSRSESTKQKPQHDAPSVIHEEQQQQEGQQMSQFAQMLLNMMNRPAQTQSSSQYH